jgi:hypothetical protein
VAVSPNYTQDKTVLAANSFGQVFLSQNGGTSFNILGLQLPLHEGTCIVSLAFDSNFTQSKIIYGASNAPVTAASKDRLFRFNIGKSSNWLSICNSLPKEVIIAQLIMTGNGVLYALKTQRVVNADKKGAVLRSLDPTSASHL